MNHSKEYIAVNRVLLPDKLAGHEIRYIRKFILKMSQDEFAESIDLIGGKSVISRWENGKQNLNQYVEKVIRQLILNVCETDIVIDKNVIPGMKLVERRNKGKWLIHYDKVNKWIVDSG